jgi:hypothetical protein
MSRKLNEFSMAPEEMNPIGFEHEEVDNEGAMAKADLYKLANYSFKLFKKIEDEDRLESWVQAKITKAADYIASVYHFIEYEKKFSEYGDHLENSDMYSESQKRVMKNKLMEAKSKIKELKIVEAKKADAPKNNPVAKFSKEFNKASVEPDKKKDSKAGKEKHKNKAVEIDESSKLNELGRDTLKSYIKASNQDVIDKSIKLGKTGSSKKQADLIHKVSNRGQGVNRATDRLEEAKPSAGLSKATKSAVVKKAKAGKDIGKPGKGFAKVEKAAKKSGATDPKAVAAAAMWKNVKKESVVNEGCDVDEALKNKSRTFKQVSKLGREKGNKKAAEMWAKKIKSVREEADETAVDPRDYTDIEGHQDDAAMPNSKPVDTSIDPRDYTDVEGNQPVVKEGPHDSRHGHDSEYDQDNWTDEDSQYVIDRSQDNDESEYEHGEEDPLDELSLKTYKAAQPRSQSRAHDAIDDFDAAELGNNTHANPGDDFATMADADRRFKKHDNAAKWASRQIGKLDPPRLRENAELDAIKLLSGLK